jgi:hypothetical protein
LFLIIFNDAQMFGATADYIDTQITLLLKYGISVSAA